MVGPRAPCNGSDWRRKGGGGRGFPRGSGACLRVPWRVYFLAESVVIISLNNLYPPKRPQRPQLLVFPTETPKKSVVSKREATTPLPGSLLAQGMPNIRLPEPGASPSFRRRGRITPPIAFSTPRRSFKPPQFPRHCPYNRAHFRTCVHEKRAHFTTQPTS